MDYWLSENRRMELVYFVRQYEDWKLLYTLFDYGLKSQKIPGGKNGTNSMEEYICNRSVIAENVEMIEKCAADVGLTIDEIISEKPDTSEFYWRLSQLRK